MNIKWWRIFLHAISFGHLEIVQYASNARFEYKDGKKTFSVYGLSLLGGLYWTLSLVH